MQSFRTEIENPIVERDIIDLEKKIALYYEGKIDEERFRSLRLARGVYGQRQFGVQMIRIKLPYGRITSEQLHRIANVSDEYSRGRLHITTRQDIQIHHVSLDRTPELWAELEKDDITLREACGNTVRNVTASETAGIDVNEPFDVSPYAHAVFEFFLRNPICQEMGRKFKISFSGTDEDTALSFMHDLGFIAKIKNGEIGFKVMLGGGLGSQARLADTLFEFISAHRIIPITEAVLRVFDRHGERAKRARARLKFLVKEIGFDAFVKLVEEEQKALSVSTYKIDTSKFDTSIDIPKIEIPSVAIENAKEYFDILNDSNVNKNTYALDIGCGTAAFLHTMKEADWAITGLEPDSAARAKAAELYQIQPQESAKLVELKPASYHAITMWHVLEHVADLSSVMEGVISKLKKNGMLVLALPNPDSWDANHYKEYWAAWDLPIHFYHFKKKNIEFLASRFGLELVEIRNMPFDSYYVSLLSEGYVGGNFKWIKAAFIGFVSNVRSGGHNASSLTYILRKSKTGA